jgi:hypothetical protein
MFQHFVGILLAEGTTSLLVAALEQNPCREAYAHWGGQEIARKWITIGAQELEEVEYGWRDIRGLASPANSPAR